MTEQNRQPNFTQREIMDMTPEQFSTYRERMAFLNEVGSQSVGSQPSAEPTRQPGMIVDRPDGRYIHRNEVTRRASKVTAAALALAVIGGGGLWLGANIFGGNGSENPGATSAPTAGETQKPDATKAPETQKPDANGFVAKETNEADGWYRTTITLSDGSNLELDELDYDPATMSDGKVVDKGAVMVGDGNIDGEFKSDSLKPSGQATLISKQGAVVGGKYGYAVFENFDPSKTDLLMQTISDNMKNDGCGLPTGCNVVMLKEYKEDGSLVDYKGLPTSSEKPVASTSPAESQHPADCICTICCTVVVPSTAPCATPEATPVQTPEAPTCEDGFDHDLDNIYHGDLAKLQADVKAGKNTEYKIVVEPGRYFYGQGDFYAIVNGKGKLYADNKSSTGALLEVIVPEDGKAVTVYAIYGGNAHLAASCTTPEEAKALKSQYKSAMEGTYDAGNVTVYTVK